MTPRHNRAWVRLLCAVALGLGLSGAATAAAAAPTDSVHARPAVAQLQGTVHAAVVPTSARAPIAVSHHVGRHLPTSIGSGLLATAALVSVLVLTARRHVTSSSGGCRRTNTVGARAPPVAIGI